MAKPPAISTRIRKIAAKNTAGTIAAPLYDDDMWGPNVVDPAILHDNTPRATNVNPTGGTLVVTGKTFQVVSGHGKWA